MAEIERYLKQLASSVEPTATQKAGAKTSHNYLRNIMQTGQMNRRIIDTYLTGSYARDTAIQPLDDVDIIFLIDPSHWPEIGFFNSNPSPDKVLQTFANAIRYRYSESSVRIQRRSVCLQMNHLNIDVVPAIRSTQSDQRYVRVPDSDTGSWILTAPKYHEDLITQLNVKYNGLLKPLVKILKHWNNSLPSTTNLKSFAIETMAVRLFLHTNLTSLQTGLFTFFDFIAYVGGEDYYSPYSNNIGVKLNMWGHEVPDTAGTGSNLVGNLTSERRVKFVLAAVRAREKIKASIDSSREESARSQVLEALRL